jgi:hypothetical protein
MIFKFFMEETIVSFEAYMRTVVEKDLTHTGYKSVRYFHVALHMTEYEHAFPARGETFFAKLNDSDA